MSNTSSPRKLAAILHADVAGYSRLMGADEEATVKLLTRCREVMNSSIATHAGRVVDTAGDSLLAEFPSVVEATKCAVEMQRQLKSCNSGFTADRRLEFRMGIELADVLFQGEELYGDGVNVAARIQSLAEPGGICVSDAVRRAVTNRLPVTFVPMGTHKVKNISEPIKIYRVITNGSSADNSAGPSFKRKAKFAIVGLIAVIALAVVLAGLLAVWERSQQEVVEAKKVLEEQVIKTSSRPEPAATAVEDKPSIAVLPFINMSGDKEQEYFSDGISADIIIDLSRVSNLQVIARNSSFYYKGRSVKTEDVGRELGVRYVLTGSVRRSGERVRITTELVDSKNARQLWADKYDRKLEDIFTLQDEITGKIVSALLVQLSAREKEDLTLRSTRNVAAYQAFLKGQRFDREGGKEQLPLAQSLYREAIRLDPHFGRAYGALAVTISRSIVWGFSGREAEQLDQALELAKQAVSLNGNLPQTHWALGYVYLQRHEPEHALAATERSIELAPNYADGYGLLALINNRLGRGEEALRLINRGMALNPRYTWDYSYNLGRAYYSLGEYSKAVDAQLEALARNQYIGFPRAHLIASYMRLGQIDDARWEAVQLQANNPEITRAHLRQEGTFIDEKAMARFLEDLEKAGVPP